MTAAERERLRAARDAHVRATIEEAHGRKYCSGCGGHIEERTLRCSTCTDRHRVRNKRKDTAA